VEVYCSYCARHIMVISIPRQRPICHWRMPEGVLRWKPRRIWHNSNQRTQRTNRPDHPHPQVFRNKPNCTRRPGNISLRNDQIQCQWPHLTTMDQWSYWVTVTILSRELTPHQKYTPRTITDSFTSPAFDLPNTCIDIVTLKCYANPSLMFWSCLLPLFSYLFLKRTGKKEKADRNTKQGILYHQSPSQISTFPSKKKKNRPTPPLPTISYPSHSTNTVNIGLIPNLKKRPVLSKK